MVNLANINGDMIPVDDPNADCHMLIGIHIGELNTNTLYTDLMGKFLVQLFSGNRFVLVAYAYGPNARLGCTMKNRSDVEIFQCYDDVYTALTYKQRIQT